MQSKTNHTTVLVIAILVLALSGVLSVAYIAVQLRNTEDKVFFASVITAFLAPTIIALLAILRSNGAVQALAQHINNQQ